MAYQPDAAHAYSQSFITLLNQIQSTYCAPTGVSFEVLRREYPIMMSTVLGHAIRQQMRYVGNNASLQQAFNQIQVDAQGFIAESIQLFGNTPTYRDMYGPFSVKTMWLAVEEGMSGRRDQDIYSEFHVAPNTAPPVLLATPQAPAGLGGGSSGKWARQEDPPQTNVGGNRIDLLGQGAPAVTGPPPVQTSPTTVNSDSIIGVWQDFGLRDGMKAYQNDRAPLCQIQITKEGKQYVGRLAGTLSPSSSKHFKCNADGVIFRIEYLGEYPRGFKTHRWEGDGWHYSYSKRQCMWDSGFKIMMQTEPREVPGGRIFDYITMTGCGAPGTTVPYADIYEFRRIGR
jgi:hypothetical protein